MQKRILYGLQGFRLIRRSEKETDTENDSILTVLTDHEYSPAISAKRICDKAMGAFAFYIQPTKHLAI